MIFMAERNNKIIVGEPQVHIETDFPELVSKKEKLLQKRQIIRRTGATMRRLHP